MRSNKENSKYFFCNDSYFHDINTKEKAYWFGFLCADGYVLSKSNVIGLSLSEKDMGHLEKFKKAINATYEIKHYISSGFSEIPYVRMQITSEEMHSDLISHGLSKNKTNILKKPIGIDESLLRYYILGYFDGDGSISLAKKEKNLCYIFCRNTRYM